MEEIKTIVSSEGLTYVDIGTGKNLFSFGPSPTCSLSIDTQIQDIKTNLKYEDLNNCFKKENNKKEKEKKKIMELLELYEDYQIRIIENEFDKETDELLEKDELVKAAKEYNQRLNLLEDEEKIHRYTLDIERVLTISTQNEMNKIIAKIKKAKNKLTDKCRIIRAHLELADTFEEKQAILKNYNVIDENGRLNVLDNNCEKEVTEVEALDLSEEKVRKEKKSWKK